MAQTKPFHDHHEARAYRSGPVKDWPSLRIHERFESLVDHQPEAPAIVTDDGIITGAELDGAANALAWALIQSGVRPEEPVGVLTDRSAFLPIAFLAILKAGAVYVPLVASLPPERLVSMVRQTRMRRIVALDDLAVPTELRDALAAHDTDTESRSILRPNPPDDSFAAARQHRPTRPGSLTGLATILFTSGSTGEPKGVFIQHDACINMAFGHAETQRLTAADRVLLATSPGFILGYRELCLPLVSGAAYVPASRQLLDTPPALLAMMARHRVSVALFTPSYLRQFNGVVPDGLRLLITAGERPNPDDARHYARHVESWNVHGATELCGAICMHKVAPDDSTVPSGRPFWNTAVVLLDGNGNAVPDGETGVIHALGCGVSRGYLGQPDLTAESFVQTPYGRAYCTHDLGRWNANGDLETLGRSDDVVKVSGQTVALGEIERVLVRHDSVTRATALQHQGRLVAFVEGSEETGLDPDWRALLARALPAFMVPAQVARVARMPLNSAGKADRQALLVLANEMFNGQRTSKTGALPQGPWEQCVATVWEDVLNVRPVWRDDNFFALGGTSLLAITISQRLLALGHAIAVPDILSALTVEALAARVAEMQEQTPTRLPNSLSKPPDDSGSPSDQATAGQEDFWIAANLGLAAAGSHILRVLAVEGPIPEPALWQAAWTALIERHPALRTAFSADAKSRIRWQTALPGTPGAQAHLIFERCATPEDAHDKIAQQLETPFNLAHSPLSRAGVLSVDSTGETLFWFVLHHAVADGTSARIVQDDMQALLLAHPLPPVPNGIALASQAEHHYLASPRAVADQAFWRDQLETLVARGGEAFEEYATDHRRPATPSGRSAPPLVERLTPGTVTALTRIAQTHRLGLHGLLLTILAAEVRRRSHRADLVIGSGVSVRPAGTEAAIGHFVNVLPVILPSDGNPSLATAFTRTQAALTRVVEHSAYPMGLLYREFRRRHPDARPSSRTSLFDIGLTAAPGRTSKDLPTGFGFSSRALPNEKAHPAAGVDLAFSHQPVDSSRGTGLDLTLVWNPDVYTESSARALLDAFAAWARWLADDPTRADAPLPALLPSEARWLKKMEFGLDRPRPEQRSHALFEAFVDHAPDHPAIVTAGTTLSYAALDFQANRLAHALLAAGVQRGDTVAVLADSSPALPAAVLAIWKAGAAYLPLPRDLPAGRLAFMAGDAGVRLLIAPDGTPVPEALAQAIRCVIRPEHLSGSGHRPESPGSPEDPAYIIYTSGTTGQPKGVIIPHRGYINSILGCGEWLEVRADDRISLVATPGFDASLWEIGIALMHGMAIVPISQDLRNDPWKLKPYYRDQGVTVAFHAPSYLRVTKHIPFEGLRVLVAGGEAPTHDDVRHHAGYLSFWNGYGPTETSIAASLALATVDVPATAPIPAGRPLPNTRITFRRSDGTPVPPGIPGELWIGGVGLGIGYLNRPDLTAERFVETPEGRFYRTGDLGRWTPNGLVELAGRIDHQIKLNGQRVEPAEIEQVLLSHPGVTEAVVLVDSLVGASNKVLLGFVRLAEGAQAPDWRSSLAHHLPAFMVPASVTIVPAIPLTPAGKIDRNQLLRMVATSDQSAPRERPQGDLEACVATLWGELLGSDIYRDDNFFALGGNSLLAVTLAHRLSEQLKTPVPARALFAAPVLVDFVRHLATLAPTTAAPLVESDLATVGEREFRLAEVAGLDTHHFTIPVHRFVEGDLPPPEQWIAAWQTLVARHSSLRTFFIEDEQGLLRRRVLLDAGGAFEFAAKPDHAAAIAHARARQAVAFSMVEPPLWRVGLVEVSGGGAPVFWLAMHHAVGDGLSVGILLEELMTLLAGRELPQPSTVGWGTVAAREEAYLAGPEGAADANYWRERLAELPDEAFEDWSLDVARWSDAEPGTHRFDVLLDPTTANRLRGLAQRHHASLHAVMLTLMAMEIRRRTGRKPLVLGTAASVRETAADACIVGYGVNMLPMVLTTDKRCFAELLTDTQRMLSEALQRARYPFARMYQDFRTARPLNRHPARFPLFDIAVTEDPGLRQPTDAPVRLIRPRLVSEDGLDVIMPTGLDIAPSRPDTGGASLSRAAGIAYERTTTSPGQDMVLIHQHQPDGSLVLQWRVNASLYSTETAATWFRSLVGWARWLAETEAQTGTATGTNGIILPALLPDEAAQLLAWEYGPHRPRPPQRFHERFERFVDSQPDRPAIVTRERIWRYADLDRWANSIANTLLKRGVGRGDTVAALVDCTAALPAAVLGIWKAGAIYLPLPRELPVERLAYMASDAGARVLLVPDGEKEPLALASVINSVVRADDLTGADSRPASAGTPDDIAYIIYTSGTTGLPKGVAIRHAGCVNIGLATSEMVGGFLPDDRIALVAIPGFDASLWELGMALLNGNAVVPISQDLRNDPWALKPFYRDLGVTVAFHAPSYLRVSKTVPFEGLRVLIAGGEAPNHDDARHHANQLSFFNGYGPTETTIIVSLGPITPACGASAPIPAGRPVPNTRLTFRRPDGTPVPPGMVGELWISGIGVADGYLNRPALTAERFVDTDEGHFYRSGDLGRWTPDGQLELSGRLDDQVKLNGQRVEPAEIQQVLTSHPAVAAAAVLVDTAATNGIRVLRGFVQLNEEATPPHERVELPNWRSYLGLHLPAFMIPASVTVVPTIPLTPAGKINRAALLAMGTADGPQETHEAPQGELEIRIAALWAECFGVEVSRQDNFFALGGNSLLAVTLAHRLSAVLGLPVPARVLFGAPTLAGFAGKVADLAPTDLSLPLAESDLATEGEREFRIAEAAGLETRHFNIPVHRLVEGKLPPPERWTAAWTQLAARYESLRTYFEEDEYGVLRRRILPDLTVTLVFTTAPDRKSALAEARVRQGEPLTVAVPPLWRAGLITVADGSAPVFWMALHHAVGDGQSLGILLDEMMALLLDQPLLPAPVGWSALAAREHAYLAGPDGAGDAHYWRDHLARLPDDAFEDWTLDFPRSSATPAGTHRFELLLDACTSEVLKGLARRHRVSMHALMVAMVAMEVRRRTGRAVFTIGTAASTRETAEDARVVGSGANMLPLAIRLETEDSFANLLVTAQQALAGALQHARYPFARIYQEFRAQRSLNRHPTRYPLFDFAVTEVPTVRPSTEAALRLVRPDTPSEAILHEYVDRSPAQDMVLIHEEMSDGRLLLQWHVNATVYGQETGLTWFRALADWMRWLAKDTDDRASTMPPALLPEEEALLAVWEQGETIARPPLRFHELFEQRLDRADAGQGDRPAVLTDSGVVTWQALEEAANVIAHALLERGAGRGQTVAVLTGRSPDLPAALLGIWKAGATYLPLAADLPPERQAFMVRDSGAAHLLVLNGLAVPDALSHAVSTVLRPETLNDAARRSGIHRPNRPGEPGDIAYILYTSGSTGQPKGALISHASFINVVLGAGERLGFTADDRSLMFASPSFDVSLSDIGIPLAFGSALCSIPFDVLSTPSRFLSCLRDFNVTVVDITPTYLRLFEGAELPNVRVLITGGEAPFPSDVAVYAARHAYFNAYGPTENTITSTMGLLSANDGGFLSGGRPMPNTSVQIRDAAGNPVPPGVVGEIWLGGAGLAQGYLNQPALTEACFRETPTGRRYRSGDLGRWRAGGVLEIVGRIDEQVKLNGIRIEPGEIEHALSTHPDVAQTAVVTGGEAGKTQCLWAFIRPADQRTAPVESDWRAWLADRLPSYMIPSTVVPIPTIPLTGSGKVDRAALRALMAKQLRSTSGGSAPQDDLERLIARTWSRALGHETVHREDSFFSLGGHSLLAITMTQRLEAALGHPVPARELFAEPTLAGFARRVRQLQSPESRSSATIGATSDRATEGQAEFWTAEASDFDTRGFNITLTLSVRGTIPPVDRWCAAWDHLVMRHDALRTGFHEDESGRLRRVVLEWVSNRLEIREASDLTVALADISQRQTEPFAMANPPLWRAGLTQIAETTTEGGKTEPGETVFWLSLHHSVGDGLSLGILLGELATELLGRSLPPLSGSFDRSAAHEELYLASDACREDAAWWDRTLSGLARTTDAFDEWPLDFPRPAGRTTDHGKGNHLLRARLDKDTTEGLRALARRNGASLHAVILTLLAFEVGRRTGRSEFLLGSTVSTRETVAEAGVVGYYVNMLPIVCQIRRSDPVEQAVRAMQRALGEGLRHSRYPFSRIYQDFRRNHPGLVHPTRYPLFDFSVTENPRVAVGADEELWFTTPAPLIASLPDEAADATHYEFRATGPTQDLVVVHETMPDGGLVLALYVNAALYEAETSKAWIRSLAGWARVVADAERQPDTPLPALLSWEKATLTRWQQAAPHPLPAQTISALFTRQSNERPDRAALVTERGVVTYAMLEERANTVAHALLACGVVQGQPVGVLTERSPTLPEVALGIWKAGACYLPLAYDLPAERLAYSARDAGVRVMLALDGLEPPPALSEIGCTLLRPEWLPLRDPPSTEPTPAPSDPACILYTSGSTGTPKGVVLHHQGIVNLAVGVSEVLDVQPSDRVLLMASPSFDLWLSDLVMAWRAGAALVPVRREEMDDIAGLRAKLVRLGVTCVSLSPSYLRLFEQAELPGVRTLMTVGEPPHIADALHYATRLAYFNGYGPTENTAATAIGRIAPGARRITAGRPLPNSTAQILDQDGLPVPPGAVGQLWIGGLGLAAGYLNRPDLTAAAFVETLNGRLYRSGDLVRWTPEGELEILGRIDTQVKLRGQRIELSEIEHELERYPGVQQAVALVDTRADGSQTLWAFVSLGAGAVEPAAADWHARLTARLPSYMVPAAVIRVPAIPVMISGKVDRAQLLRALPSSSDPSADVAQEKTRTPPRTPAEKRIAALWAELFDRPSISCEDNFFELGGDSLRVIAMVSRLRRDFSCKINDLYENPVLADFARVCHSRSDHMRALIRSARNHWQAYRDDLAAYDAQRSAALEDSQNLYASRIRRDLEHDLGPRRAYGRVLLTGSTGYLGSYLVRALLAGPDPIMPDRVVTVLIRGSDDAVARNRLEQVLCGYFGAEEGTALARNSRLDVFAGDLRRDDLGLPANKVDRLAQTIQAVFHCAAKVDHFGHYSDFHADNVAATRRLLALAARGPEPADFHFVSTLSVAGRAPDEGFRLFTEFDPVPETLDENYYVRTKQEAERLVVAARSTLANASIHRIGNVMFATEGQALQRNLKDNAFFRQLAAFIRLGAVPDDLHLWPCHVNLAARAVVALAESRALVNDTHHIEHARQSTVADFITTGAGMEQVRATSFGAFLDRLLAAVDEPEMEAALTGTMETFGLYSGLSPQGRTRRLDVVTDRTQALLSRLGVSWPTLPKTGQTLMLQAAARFFS